MCANPAVSPDNHAASDNCARTDPAAGSYLCSGLNHRQRPDLGRRIDERSLGDDCGRVNTGRNRWHGIEQCSNTRPSSVWFGREDRHGPSRHSRCHVRMHNHSTGRCLIECRCITPVVQKTHFVRASRLQRRYTFEEQIEFIRNPACRSATTASGYGPLRRKNLASPMVASTICRSPWEFSVGCSSSNIASLTSSYEPQGRSR